MLEIIDGGEAKIIKVTKNGVYVMYKGSKLFLPKSCVDIDEAKNAMKEKIDER